jgi:hypothetical protein
VVVDVCLEYTEFRVRATAPDVYVGTERVQVGSSNWPVGDIDLPIREGSEHGVEIGIVMNDEIGRSRTEGRPRSLLGGILVHSVNLNVSRHRHQKCKS